MSQAVQWTFTSIAIVLSVGRYYIRYRIAHTVDLSDISHAIALVFLIALTVQATMSAPLIKKLYFPNSGDEPTAADVALILRYQLSFGLTYLIALYCVKFSFLFFYRLLFGVLQSFMQAWWAVTVFTFLTFWPCLVTNLANCGGNARDRFNACTWGKAGP